MRCKNTMSSRIVGRGTQSWARNAGNSEALWWQHWGGVGQRAVPAKASGSSLEKVLHLLNRKRQQVFP